MLKYTLSTASLVPYSMSPDHIWGQRDRRSLRMWYSKVGQSSSPPASGQSQVCWALQVGMGVRGWGGAAHSEPCTPSLLEGIGGVRRAEVTPDNWVKSEKNGLREKQLLAHAPATASQRWKPAHSYRFAKMHAGKLLPAVCNFALRGYNFFAFLSTSPPLSGSTGAGKVPEKRRSRAAPVGGTLGGLASENDPASNGGTNGIPHTTHSKAIKQARGRGRVCACVFFTRCESKER